jgi:hypothetical protein
MKPVEPEVKPPMAPAATPTAPSTPVTKPTTPVAPVEPPVKGVVPIAPAQVPEAPRVNPVQTPAVQPPVAPPPAAVLPQPAPLPQPQPLPILPPPTRQQPSAAGPGSGKFIVLKGNKLVEGSVSVAGEKAVLRQGSFEREMPKTDVLFVAETKDDVYRFMLAQVPATDAAARLGVARWCMFAGLREQALVEAREVLKIQPINASAAQMVRSLEESLKLAPPDGSAPVVAVRPPGGVLETELDVDLTAEGATTFASRAQPVLANQCMECHARADYAGAFKLVRVTGFEVGPQSTRANMHATAAQLRKDDPLNSPLLVKALTAHGGMRQPAFATRQALAFRVLEAWVQIATPPAVPPMTVPALPVFPEAHATPQPAPAIPPALPSADPPAIPVIPPATETPAASGTQPRVNVPPVEVQPAIPGAPIQVPLPPIEPNPAAVPPATFPEPPDAIVPVAPAPTARPATPELAPLPVAPAPTPIGRSAVPPVLPTPPNMPTTGERVKLPKPPAVTGSGTFGTQAPPKPATPEKPAARDEFDPAAFNKLK